MWYWRSARLGRRANDNIARANAHLGLGNLAIELGKFDDAEAHLRKAARASLRQGRKSLAAAAHHNLLACQNLAIEVECGALALVLNMKVGWIRTPL